MSDSSSPGTTPPSVPLPVPPPAAVPTSESLSSTVPLSTSPFAQDLIYEEGEKILAFHQSLLYEAKVLKVSEVDSATKKRLYLIHYQGWNDRWDEWVDTTRIMKYTEDNKKLQDDLKTEYRRSSTSRRMRGNGEGKSKKRKMHHEKAVDLKYKIDLPIVLKKKLIEDYDFITCQRYLTVLPRTPTANDILDKFSEYLDESKTSIPKMEEVVEDLRSYFDKALGTFVLYRFERHQYREILKQYSDKNLRDVYGFEHLLRLCVKFPYALSMVEMDEDTLKAVKGVISELLRFMAENLTKFSSNPAYEPAAPQYIRMAT